MSSDLAQSMLELARRARQASRRLPSIGSDRKNAALRSVAVALDTERTRLQAENARDLEAAVQRGLAAPMVDRLRLTDGVLAQMIDSLHQVAALPDPVGSVGGMTVRPNGLRVGKMRIPLGVIAMIYESRPNVTVEAASLCFKSGNAVILRGGSEAFHSNQALAGLLRDALSQHGLPVDAIQLVPTTDRQAMVDLLKLDEWIDLAIPRGGEGLIRFVAEHARMPVLKHYKGVCHTYVDADAELGMAVALTMNGKVQRPGVCNATETLLIHQQIADRFVPRAGQALHEAGVELRVCDRTAALLGEIPWKPVTEADYYAEFLDRILAVRVVDSLAQAIEHIQTYGSDHTEAIVTQSYAASQQFVQEVTSACVLVNASTRFCDGYQLGLGAEIGISTTKLHAYGPMGLEELTAEKFIVYGNGQIRT